MSKIKLLLTFSQGWQELAERSDKGCSGIVEGPQNIWFSCNIHVCVCMCTRTHILKCREFRFLLGSQCLREILFKCCYPHVPGW